MKLESGKKSAFLTVNQGKSGKSRVNLIHVLAMNPVMVEHLLTIEIRINLGTLVLYSTYVRRMRITERGTVNP